MDTLLHNSPVTSQAYDVTEMGESSDSVWTQTNATWSTNDSFSTEDPIVNYMPVEAMWIKVSKATFMFTIIIAAILGNILVILAVFSEAKLKIISNSFIVSLAFADLLVAGLVMPFSALQLIVGYWLFGQTMCDVFNANDVLFSTASLLHLCCISMDRYIAITDPFHYHRRMTRKLVAIMLCIAWGLSALISHIPVHTGIYTTKDHRHLLYPYDDRPDIGICFFVVNRIYAIVSSCCSFWIPALVMVFTYLKVFLEARRQEKSMAKQIVTVRSNSAADVPFNGVALNGSGKRRMSDEKRFKREHKAAKTLGVIMGAFLACWLPFFLWYVITTLCGDTRCHTPEWLVNVLFWVGYLNSALNPIIYAVLNTEFRKAFINILRCQRLRRICVRLCCGYCVRRGWVRRASDQESSYFADLPSRRSRPSIASATTSIGRRSSTTYSNGHGRRPASSSASPYMPVAELDEPA